jgi:hypothetical protein
MREYLYIPERFLHRFVGRKVHCDWASPQCHWFLNRLDGKYAELCTSKGKKLLVLSARLQTVRGKESFLTHLLRKEAEKKSNSANPASRVEVESAQLQEEAGCDPGAAV